MPKLIETTTVKLKDLVPDPKNTRVHDERNIQEIMTSLKQNGQYRDFVIQKSNSMIRVGNGMFEAMKRLKWKEGTAKVMDLTDEEATALSIIDNRTSDLSTFDEDILKDVMEDLSGDFLKMTGFSDEEIDILIEDIPVVPDEDPKNFKSFKPGVQSGKPMLITLSQFFVYVREDEQKEVISELCKMEFTEEEQEEVGQLLLADILKNIQIVIDAKKEGA